MLQGNKRLSHCLDLTENIIHQNIVYLEHYPLKPNSHNNKVFLCYTFEPNKITVKYPRWQIK